jgi:hypothetical protein
LNIIVIFSKGTVHISWPIPVFATIDIESARSMMGSRDWSDELYRRRIVDGISRIKDTRMVQSSHPTVLSCIFQRARKRTPTDNPARVTRAAPTREVICPELRYGALHAFFCHLWATGKDVSKESTLLVPMGQTERT